MSQLPSKYLPIWNQLKQTKVCRVTAPLEYHRTIIKMVKNKRDDDLAYRYMLAEKHLTHELKTVVLGTVITFTLKEILTIGGL
jgi:hypothetical protein